MVVSPLKIGKSLKQVNLPVAAMPLYKGELFAVYRAKMRPCLVISATEEPVDKKLRQGKANHSTAGTLCVAPYYGVAQSMNRAGYSEQFVERVRHCEYSRFIWDCLPGTREDKGSILRLDQIQPIGSHSDSFEMVGYRLSDEALEVVDEILLPNPNSV